MDTRNMKKRLYVYILTVILLSCVATASAGQHTIDSADDKVDTLSLFRSGYRMLNSVAGNENVAARIDALLELARLHEDYGTLDSAIYYYSILKNLYTQGDNALGVAETSLILNGLYGSRADYSKAMEEVDEALKIYENAGDQEGIARCYTQISDLLYYENKYQESVAYADKAIVLQKALGAWEDLGISLRYKASSQLFIDGALNDALTTVNQAIDLYREKGENGLPFMASLNGRGNILKYMGRYEEAIADYRLIYEKALEMGMDRYAIPSVANIGHVYVMQEKYEEAIPYILEAIERMKKTGDTKNLWENYMHLSDIYKNLNDYENAYTYFTLYAENYQQFLNTIIERLESEALIKYETAKKNEMIALQKREISNQQKITILSVIIVVLLIASLIGMSRSRIKIRRKQREIEQSREELRQSLENLKTTQAQLIHAEKMASLGELTAGIAHEIQNPLNFVNNFSEVSVDLMEELEEEVSNGNARDIKDLTSDLKQNLEKINVHGKRAGSIVKGMLEHSRTGNGERTPTDINALADEYLRLAYHGLRAKDKSFQSAFEISPDPSLPKIMTVQQDIGRVLLNLINNAFYAVFEKTKQNLPGYKPLVTVKTNRKSKTDNRQSTMNSSISGGLEIEIQVKDNGNGIPDSIKEKIFQPFFTTKPTGEGTGLGLSLSYDIVTKGHGGDLKVETSDGEGTTFTIQLPIMQSGNG
jgi:signal transduction histidine kinase